MEAFDNVDIFLRSDFITARKLLIEFLYKLVHFVWLPCKATDSPMKTKQTKPLDLTLGKYKQISEVFNWFTVTDRFRQLNIVNTKHFKIKDL